MKIFIQRKKIIKKSKKNPLRNKVFISSLFKTYNLDDFYFNSYYWNELEKESLSLWESSGGDKSVAKSFLILNESIPHCFLEDYALQCGQFHCPNGFIGVEYWIQVRDCYYNEVSDEKAGLEFHFGIYNYYNYVLYIIL